MKYWRDHWTELWRREPLYFVAMSLLLFCIIFVCCLAIWILVVIGTEM